MLKACYITYTNINGGKTLLPPSHNIFIPQFLPAVLAALPNNVYGSGWLRTPQGLISSNFMCPKILKAHIAQRQLGIFSYLCMLDATKRVQPCR